VDSTGGGTPLRICPTTITSPDRSWKHTPVASYANISTEDYPYSLYCHCEIVGLNNHGTDYHDSVIIAGLDDFETKEVSFDTFTTQEIDNYRAIFYIKNTNGPSFPTDTMSVDFKYDPLEIGESRPSGLEPVSELISPVGREIGLRFFNYPNGFHASVFDASGRMVDEIRSTQTQGTIQWGEGRVPGVYFIRAFEGNRQAQKVILVK
jgi:hypothetical protein